MIASSTLAGATLPPDRKLTVSTPCQSPPPAAKSPHRSLYFTYSRHAALLFGDWKIVRTKPTENWRLFNLRQRPPAKQPTSATKHPDQLARLPPPNSTAGPHQQRNSPPSK